MDPTPCPPTSEAMPGRARHGYALDILAVLLLLLICLKALDGLRGYMDLPFYDQAHYTQIGLTLMTKGPEPQQGPLYQLWHWGLSWIARDPIDLFYLSYGLTVTGTALVFYGLARAAGAQPWAGLVAASYLVHTRGWRTNGQSHLFAALVVALVLMVALRIRTRTWAFTVAALGLLAGAYIRPDLVLSFLLLGAVTALVILRAWWQRPASWLRVLAPAVVLVAVPAFLFRSLGNPLHADEARHNRALMAFGQGFANHYLAWRGSNAGGATGWAQVVHEQFGDSVSVLQAAAANPRMFLWHIGCNARELIPHLANFYRLSWGQYEAVASESRVQVATTLLLLLGAMMIPAWGIGRRWRREGRGAFLSEPRRRLLLWVLAALLPAALVSSLLGYSYARYYLPAVLVAAAAALGAATSGQTRPELWARSTRRLLFVGLAILALSPTIGHKLIPDALTGQARTPTAATHPNLMTILYLRTQALPAHARVLDANAMWAYLEPTADLVWAEDKGDRPFRAFLAAKDINIIPLDSGVCGDPSYQHDPQWQEFLRHPEADGFHILTTPNPELSVAVRSHDVAQDTTPRR